MKDIALIYSPPIVSRAPVSPATSPSQGQDFQTYLTDAFNEVNTLHEQEEHAIEQFIGEGTGDLQEVMVAMEKADITFEFMMQIRNKALEAYQEIMRMQV